NEPSSTTRTSVYLLSKNITGLRGVTRWLYTTNRASVASLGAWMRATVAAVVASISFALLGACTKSISDTDYAREGIGVELSRSALPTQTELQNIYLANLCQQASSSLLPIECTAIAPNQWPLIVQAGMNDIDLRCDAYLTWLDNVKR